MSEDNAQIDACKVRAKQAAAAAKGGHSMLPTLRRS